MTSDRAQHTTRLLNLYSEGDHSVEPQLLESVYTELHQLAAACMRGRAGEHTLQPTALINEAWLRLVRQDELHFDGRAQFFQLASKIMRSVLVDHARRTLRDKRGGGKRPVPLDEAQDSPAEGRLLSLHDVLDLEEGLTRLEEIEPDLARVVEMRFFGGLNHPEIARELDVSLRTVENRWRLARAWLHANLSR